VHRVGKRMKKKIWFQIGVGRLPLANVRRLKRSKKREALACEDKGILRNVAQPIRLSTTPRGDGALRRQGEGKKRGGQGYQDSILVYKR